MSHTIHQFFNRSLHPLAQEAEVDCGWILKSNKTGRPLPRHDFSCSIQLNSLIDMSYQDHQPASAAVTKAGADFNAFSAQTAAKVCKTIYLSSTASASKSYCQQTKANRKHKFVKPWGVLKGLHIDNSLLGQVQAHNWDAFRLVQECYRPISGAVEELVSHSPSWLWISISALDGVVKHLARIRHWGQRPH